MIFTGVTGGEIVSLLYPLFILSPFCYIIISKESLDGPPCDFSWHGDLRLVKKAEPAKQSVYFCGNGGGPCLRMVYRHGAIYLAGSDHDTIIPGGQASGKEL